jgi:hypothetical protein
MRQAITATGRRPHTTPDEREEIYRLADAGLSSRAIAEIVFGNSRLKDRAWRLVRARRHELAIRAEPGDLEASRRDLDRILDQLRDSLKPAA